VSKRAATLVERIEEVTKTATQQSVDQVLSLKGMAGERPAFMEKVSDDEIARAYLPVWWVLGQAEDEVAVPFWEAVLQAHGPKEAFAFDTTMRRLHHDEKYFHYASVLATPELAKVYQQLRATGRHQGKVRPTGEEQPQ